MQNSVRYYIVKTEDQPVVRSVPVAKAAPRPAMAALPAESAPVGATQSAIRPGRGRPLSEVARLMRSAIRRNERDQ